MFKIKLPYILIIVLFVFAMSVLLFNAVNIELKEEKTIDNLKQTVQTESKNTVTYIEENVSKTIGDDFSFDNIGNIKNYKGPTRYHDTVYRGEPVEFINPVYKGEPINITELSNY